MSFLLTGRWPASAARCALTARRTRSFASRDGVGFIEIVDSPNQAAFEVAPGAEIFHVKVAIPTASTLGARESSGQTSGQTCAQR